MIIRLTKGAGEGRTELSAFDKALLEAGIANYNLIPLSSIIPDKTQMLEEKPKYNKDHYGNRLYVVMAEMRISEPGKEAWAGVGYVQNKSGKGLLVEHHADSEAEVRKLITDSLEDLKKNRKEMFNETDFGEIHHWISGIKCKKNPVCAISVAVFQEENW